MANEAAALIRRATSDGGHPPSVASLFTLLHAELKDLAGRAMRAERVGHTLQPTALVNEVFMRLVGSETLAVRDVAHFRAVAARAMRHVLVNHAKARNAAKRGGGARPFTLQDDDGVTGESAVDFLDLEDALETLEQRSPRQARVVAMRFYGGLTIEQIAAVEDVSEKSIDGDWRFARAWLHRRLEGGSP